MDGNSPKKAVGIVNGRSCPAKKRFGDNGSGLGEIRMKKILVGAISAVALSMSVPASAADLAARPYTKAPPPMVAPIYDWTGFYIGANGGWGQSHGCVDFVTPAGTVAGGCAYRSGGP